MKEFKDTIVVGMADAMPIDGDIIDLVQSESGAFTVAETIKCTGSDEPMKPLFFVHNEWGADDRYSERARKFAEGFEKVGYIPDNKHYSEHIRKAESIFDYGKRIHNAILDGEVKGIDFEQFFGKAGRNPQINIHDVI